MYVRSDNFKAFIAVKLWFINGEVDHFRYGGCGS